MTDVLIVCNCSGTIEQVNTALERAVGCGAAMIVGGESSSTSRMAE
jgi:hypothetical protein